MRNTVSRWIERRGRSWGAENSSELCIYCTSSPDEKVGFSERYPASGRLYGACLAHGSMPVSQATFPHPITRTSGSDRWLCVRACCDRGLRVEGRGTPYLVRCNSTEPAVCTLVGSLSLGGKKEGYSQAGRAGLISISRSNTVPRFERLCGGIVYFGSAHTVHSLIRASRPMFGSVRFGRDFHLKNHGATTEAIPKADSEPLPPPNAGVKLPDESVVGADSSPATLPALISLSQVNPEELSNVIFTSSGRHTAFPAAVPLKTHPKLLPVTGNRHISGAVCIGNMQVVP